MIMSKSKKDDFTIVITMVLLLSFFAWNVFFVEKEDASVDLSTNAHMLSIHVKRLSDGVEATSHCSSTAIGSRTILTASHCLIMPAGVILKGVSLRGNPTIVEKHIMDGKDHSIIIFSDETFKSWVKLDQKDQNSMYVGKNVQFWGWPSNFGKMYRKGYISAIFKKDGKAVSWYLDMQGFPGDSGSGVYDESGRLIGVVSNMKFQSMKSISMRYVEMLNFNFTEEQIGMIR